MSANTTSYETLDDVIHGMNQLSNDIKKARREFNTDPKRLQKQYVSQFSPRMDELRTIASELEIKADSAGQEKLRVAERTMMAAAASYIEGLINSPRHSNTSAMYSSRTSIPVASTRKKPDGKKMGK